MSEINWLQSYLPCCHLLFAPSGRYRDFCTYMYMCKSSKDVLQFMYMYMYSTWCTSNMVKSIAHFVTSTSCSLLVAFENQSQFSSLSCHTLLLQFMMLCFVHAQSYVGVCSQGMFQHYTPVLSRLWVLMLLLSCCAFSSSIRAWPWTLTPPLFSNVGWMF